MHEVRSEDGAKREVRSKIDLNSVQGYLASRIKPRASHVFTSHLAHSTSHFKIMKLLPLLLILFASCAPSEPEVSWEAYGAEITAEQAIAVSDVIDQFTLERETPLKISGTLHEVCAEKGCWTKIETEDGRMVRMMFKDYGFFLPTDAAGRQMIAEGVGLCKETSVEELRHYAKDAKKTDEEIAAITEPKIEYLFEAAGVLLN